MIDFRPVANIIGWLLVALGAIMLVPSLVDLAYGSLDYRVFLISAFVTMIAGGLVVIATSNALSPALTLRQSFLVTTLSWVVLPVFGAIPLEMGLDHVNWTDAIFESMSGITTTGSTVFDNLESMPPGILLWRSILQWLGGLGIVLVALIFLPVMKVGGMQHFRSEGFDTMGKVLPRAADISWMLLQIYAGLTILCAAAYLLCGMSTFDAVNHALTTLSTGGFSTRDTSFALFDSATHWVSIAFMWLAGLPFIRYLQLINGSYKPFFADIQIRAYFRWTLYAIGAVLAYRLLHENPETDGILRETAFNVVSVFSGTGFGSADVSAWGDFPILVLIVVGFIGACTASTGCSLKVFRFLVLFEAIRAQLKQLVYPNRVVPLHLDGRRLDSGVVDSVVVMFTAFVVGFGVLTVLLSLSGLEMRTALTAAWTSICNVGPAFGPGVGPTGAMHEFPTLSKWLMILAMLMGRLEMVAVLVLVLPRFWRG
ncbi:potassium transporter TrkH [Pararhodobacter marinus]|uniref:Trk system potassium uptake protein n=1 Tax=Pararhodobacter marinus TaxID=2184063 RepID=A0A2U2C8A5_9RHOB|nr:TrkH family potassium uptake protein [Pararhodobacter marinus]PWE28081.1 potassium transporter TrkH [Pararhodobacter marinus]